MVAVELLDDNAEGVVDCLIEIFETAPLDDEEDEGAEVLVLEALLVLVDADLIGTTAADF